MSFCNVIFIDKACKFNVANVSSVPTQRHVCRDVVSSLDRIIRPRASSLEDQVKKYNAHLESVKNHADDENISTEDEKVSIKPFQQPSS